MKKLLPFCLLIFSFSLSAQLSLTQSFNEPKPGDMETNYPLDTSAFSSGLPINVTGNNVVWNYTALKANQPVIENYYFSAASETSSASYPGCTFVQESNGVYSYFKSTPTPQQTEILGVKSFSMAATFTNSGIVAKYPITFGSSSTDNMSGSFTFSVQGTCSGNIVTMADGSGTLNLPEGITLTNVLRVKSIQTLTLTAFFTQAGVLKQTIYNYYHASQKFPVLSINYSYLSTIFTSTPTTSGFATGSYAYFVTGLKENILSANDVRLFPNPAQNSLYIELNPGIQLNSVKLFNQLGQLVLNSFDARDLDLKNLESGVYTAEIRTDKGISRKKILKE